MSYKPEVSTDGSRTFSTNALRFATYEEADASARSLMMRWLLVTDYRATESDDPVNYKHVDGRDVPIRPDPDPDYDDNGNLRAGVDHADGNIWRIKSSEHLYWSNENGWGDADSATLFTDAQRLTSRLPLGGEWTTNK